MLHMFFTNRNYFSKSKKKNVERVALFYISANLISLVSGFSYLVLHLVYYSTLFRLKDMKKIWSHGCVAGKFLGTSEVFEMESTGLHSWVGR